MRTGHWLAIEHDTPMKPETLRIARCLQISPAEAFLLLFRMWTWFDKHTADGISEHTTIDDLDAMLGCQGFSTATAAVGWLVIREDAGLEMPFFDSHTSQSAKARQNKARRQDKYRQNVRGDPPPDESPRERHDSGAEASTGESQKAPPTVTGTDTVTERETTYVRTYESLLEEVEELRDAALRTIDPKPAEELRFDPFVTLKEKHLESSEQMAIWHQCQLSSVSPAMGDTEADLLLVLAAAKTSRSVPQSQIKTSRRALFVWLIRNREFDRCLKHLPAAVTAVTAMRGR